MGGGTSFRVEFKLHWEKKELDKAVWEESLKEVAVGWAASPLEVSEIPWGSVASRQFAIRQDGKVRLIDGLFCGGVSGSATSFEKPILHGAVMIMCLAMAELKKNAEHNS